jgi:uncharacterized protein (UPF0332 family)
MSLENLLKTKQLKEHRPAPAEIRRLLDAANRNLKDSAATNISPENRFDAAYKAVMQSALAALMANGFAPDKKSVGHHAVTIQSLPKTVGIANDRIAVLDALRNKRNQADYTGKEIDEPSVEACRAEASKLLAEVAEWMKKNRPDLLK